MEEGIVHHFLLQEKWTVSQEKSKLAALQTAVEQERSLLTEQLTRERNELGRAKVGQTDYLDIPQMIVQRFLALKIVGG